MSQNGQLWCLSWWFCLLSWITLIDVAYFGYFWLGWLMAVGRYEGVAPSMWPFAAWFWRMNGSCAIYVAKNDLFFAIFWQFATLLGPGKRAPPSPPKKRFFLSFPKETWHLVGAVFRGEPKWKIGAALRWFPPILFLNIKLPFWDIDGATPTHSPKSCCKWPHRWSNSLIPPDIHQPT